MGSDYDCRVYNIVIVAVLSCHLPLTVGSCHGSPRHCHLVSRICLAAKPDRFDRLQVLAEYPIASKYVDGLSTKWTACRQKKNLDTIGSLGNRRESLRPTRKKLSHILCCVHT